MKSIIVSMKSIIERIAKLIDVKSGMTLSFAYVFAKRSLSGDISSEQFLTIFTVVISFYFGTQYAKKGGGGNGN